jgi:hypothetical protein
MKTNPSSDPGCPPRRQRWLALPHPKLSALASRTPAFLLALVLPALAAAGVAQAANPIFGARLVARPLTPGDITKYALPSGTETAGGISNVGVGTPVYLEVQLTNTIAASNVLSVTWSLTNLPVGSRAYLTNSPLGANVPLYGPSDQLVYQVVSRQLLRPDIAGNAVSAEQYTVVATVNTYGYGITNLSYTFTAGYYLGVETCSLCHSGGEIASNIVPSWQTTAHSMIFTQGIDGVLGSYSKSCLQCHTVGYDTNATSLPDQGFYAVAQQLGWTFPTNLASTNFAYIQAHYPQLANLANIQCENCHGPGSQHAYSLGNTNLIAVTLETGDCNQCHDAPSHHIYGTEWYASSHAVTTRIPSGSGRDYCVGCHTSTGFINRLASGLPTTVPPADTTYNPIGCQACHEPHGITVPTNNPHLIREMASVTMPDGTVVTNAGEGALCIQCHHNRNGSVTTILANYPIGSNDWAGGSSFGPHDGPQGDMFEGVNAYTYGLAIPSSAHRNSVTNSCVGCHMQAIASTDPGLYLSGGHTWEMSYLSTNLGATNKVEQTGVCAQCHGQIASFDFPVQDNNGVIQGVQTSTQGLLNQLSTLLPNSSGVIDGLVKTSLSVKTNWTQQQLEAAYNWEFVANDGSLGVHNYPYASGLLKASIANLTGISVAGGLPDAWAIEYFGSPTNANAAPNADPAGDGIPNWLKYALGLNPLVKGAVVPGGVVYADGSELGGNGTNSVKIYTAAEVAFNTVPGETYQIQEVTALSGSWQTISTNIPGTGASYSYLTPTRNNTQQFFRVLQSP